MLKILLVFWGRRNTQTCTSSFRRNNETTCEQENFLAIAQKFCDGQRSCSIYAHKDWLGDPCPMYSKYLEITFQCSLRKYIIYMNIYYINIYYIDIYIYNIHIWHVCMYICIYMFIYIFFSILKYMYTYIHLFIYNIYV